MKKLLLTLGMLVLSACGKDQTGTTAPIILHVNATLPGQLVPALIYKPQVEPGYVITIQGGIFLPPTDTSPSFTMGAEVTDNMVSFIGDPSITALGDNAWYVSYQVRVNKMPQPGEALYIYSVNSPEYRIVTKLIAPITAPKIKP